METTMEIETTNNRAAKTPSDFTRMKISITAIALGNILMIVCLGVPRWSGNLDGDSMGLFTICEDGSCSTIDDPSDKLMAVRAMAILSLMCGLAALALVTVFMVFRRNGKPVNVLIVVASLPISFAALIFTFVGIVVYITMVVFDQPSSYGGRSCMIIFTAAGGLFGGGGIQAYRGRHFMVAQ